jgi:hypothetical protein
MRAVLQSTRAGLFATQQYVESESVRDAKTTHELTDWVLVGV